MGELLLEESLPPRNLFDSMMASLLLFSHQINVHLLFMGAHVWAQLLLQMGLSHQWTGLI
jgi:hypothetical protein